MAISPTHVYTYHQEGLKPGGGLWVCDFSAEEVRKTMILGSPEGVILEIEPGRWGAKASLLGQIIANGHPDEDGEKQIDLTADEKHRIYAWMDLNSPYYRSSDSAYRENKGCRQIVPPKLAGMFADVAKRRCNSCHAKLHDVLNTQGEDGFFIRLDHPERNGFLSAPLAKAAGGTGACGTDVFPDTGDPDYRMLIDTFKDTRKMLEARPRMDMHALDEVAR